MNTNTLDWILAKIPVGRDWRGELLENICPFKKCVLDTGAVSRSFFELSASNGLYIDLYLEASVDTVHSILLPTLKQRFSSQSRPVYNAEPILDRGYGVLQTSRPSLKDHMSDVQINHACLASRLYVLRSQLRKPGVEACYEELTTALNACFTTSTDLAAFAKTNYLNWLDKYLGTRYNLAQVSERNQQEQELTQFMKTRTPIETSVMLSPLKKQWIEVSRNALEEGVQEFSICLQKHINRFVLDHFEVGRIWFSVYKSALKNQPSSSFQSVSYQ